MQRVGRISMKMRTEYTCPLELVHDMIKGKWKPIILWRLRLGATSLAKLEKDIDGITQKMLLEQLKELIDYGFVQKKSLPFVVEDAPSGTTSVAIVLEDKDAYPVTGGFAWIHWLAANITRFEIKDNESQTATDFIQGRNSWTSIQGGEQSVELSSFYGGMTPPDKPHIYELHVYALDKLLDLRRGFLLNELYREMAGHILAEYTLKGIYEN